MVYNKDNDNENENDIIELIIRRITGHIKEKALMIFKKLVLNGCLCIFLFILHHPPPYICLSLI